MTILRDPAWNSLLAQSDWDDAYDELQARLDRADDHAPSICPPHLPGGQRPVSSRAIPHPQPPTALATGRSAATGTPSHHEEAAAACQRPAA